MRYAADWIGPDGQLLHLTSQTLQVFCEHAQTAPQATEAGGILLGTAHQGGGLVITEASVPTWRDGRSRFGFLRSDHWHRYLAQSRWLSSGQSTRYIGEWHTHPEGVPSPSALDLREWRRLASCREDGLPLIAIVVGWTCLTLNTVAADGQLSAFRAI